MEHIFTAGICSALTSLEVKSMALPDSAISQCLQLKELYLDNVWCAKPEGTPVDGPSEKSRPVPHIEEIDYTSSTTMIKRILQLENPKAPVASLSNLRLLDLIPEHQEDMALA
jgi:hypothetical protein